MRHMILFVSMVILSNSALACAALTKKGTPCRRSPAPGSAYCWQHGGGRQASPTTSVRQTPTDKKESVQRKDESAEQQVLIPVSDGKIHKLFGFEVGDLLGNYDKAKKLSDKKYRINNIMRLADPFTVCKNVSCYYSAKERRLFKIILSSDEYLNPDETKMRKRVADMAKAVGEKFAEDLEMEKKAFGYSAKFKRDVPQKLSIDIVSVDGSRKKKIVITFVDKVVELD